MKQKWELIVSVPVYLAWFSVLLCWLGAVLARRAIGKVIDIG